MDPLALIKCSGCNKRLPQSDFALAPKGPPGTRLKSCSGCCTRMRGAQQEKRRRNKSAKENLGPNGAPPLSGSHLVDSSDADDSDDIAGLSVIEVQDFRSILKEHGAVLKLEALVNTQTLSPPAKDRNPTTRQETAEAIAKLILEDLGYRFIYQSKYDHKRSFGTSTRYMFNCCQNLDRQHAPSKSNKPDAKTDGRHGLRMGIRTLCAESETQWLIKSMQIATPMAI